MGISGNYDAIAVTPESLNRFMASFRSDGFVGGNVTTPHKQTVFASVDRVEPDAQAIGAVNTVWLDGNLVVGGNTDAYGFLMNMDERAPGWDDARALMVVLGSGGAARAVVHGALQRGLRVHVTNRTYHHAEAIAAQFGHRVTAGRWDAIDQVLPMADVLVNTTTLGMDGAPPLALDLRRLPTTAVVCDIIYVPLITPLLNDALARGNRVVDGLGMLLHQAVPGFTRWFGQIPSVTPALRRLLSTDIVVASTP